ncbi:MAG: HlyD family efflux transporter periplasmic adaptor subunit [Synechococcaceae bacterium WB9_2_112]|nr:HlyD family efflux transporter periplasmic adaptor subunit [Synechococcaceae bacterium WB9_2_112]
MPRSNPAGALVRAAQNLLERRVQANREELGLQQSRFLVRTIVWLLIGTTGAAVAWLALAKTDEVVVAPGKLEPVGAVKTVQMPVGGVLDTILVRDGQRVKQGQLLLRLDNDATLDRAGSLRQALAAKQAQLELKALELRRYQDLNDTQQQVLQSNLQLEKQIMSKLSTLQKTGAASEMQYLQQRNKVREIDGEITKTKVDRLRQLAILQQSVQQLRGELADLRSKLVELTVNIRYQDLRSPVAGVVFDLKPKGTGYVAQSSEPVMKIVPFSALQAKVEIDSAHIGFVRRGGPVDLSIDSFPATDFGVLQGTLASVGSDALPPDELNRTYRFPATVNLNTQQFRLKSGQVLPLQVGMSLTANIKLRKVSYLQLLLGSFQNKAKALREI